jgi:hypothetical protein
VANDNPLNRGEPVTVGTVGTAVAAWGSVAVGKVDGDVAVTTIGLGLGLKVEMGTALGIRVGSPEDNEQARLLIANTKTNPKIPAR